MITMRMLLYVNERASESGTEADFYKQNLAGNVNNLNEFHFHISNFLPTVIIATSHGTIMML